MEVMFDAAGKPVKGKVTDYLLEAPRVVKHAEGEQNFHVFYTLLEGMPAADKAALGLEGMAEADFGYLGAPRKTKTKTMDKDNDKEKEKQGPGGEFEALRRAMDGVGLSSAVQQSLLRTVATVLWLGNVEFEDDAAAGGESGKCGSRPASGPGAAAERSRLALGHAARLLGVDEAALARVLVQRSIVTRTDTVNKVLHKEEAYKTRDALAKALYGRAFERLVREVNAAVSAGSRGRRALTGFDDLDNAAAEEEAEDTYYDSRTGQRRRKHSSIGVLDIYGFEILEHNSFEQLCINYCNEKLQQLFIELTLKAEQDEYAEEGIAWEHVAYFNNKTVCDLIEVKRTPFPGILALLDEECSLLGKVSDLTLLKKLDKTLAAHPHYVEVKTSPFHFTVRHYAGEVTYQATGFLDKNKDTLYRDVVELLGGASEDGFVRALFPEAGAARDQKRPPTAAQQFRAQMHSLIAALQLCDPQYIRCIKPNEDKLAGVFDEARVTHQARYLGLLENVKVRRAGFAHRKPISDFVHRYKMLSLETWPRSRGGDEKRDVSAILEAVGVDENGFRLGNTKVFVRKPMTLFALEEARDVRVQKLTAGIQRCFRTWRARKAMKHMRDRSLALLAGRKRRGASFRLYFVGDYAGAASQPAVARAANGSAVLFADSVSKVSRGCKPQTRLLVLTASDLILFRSSSAKKHGQRQCGAVSRRLPLAKLASAALSSYADGYVCFRSADPAQPALLVHSSRKTEIVTRLALLLGDKLDLSFQDSFQYQSLKPSLFNASTALESRTVNFKATESQSDSGQGASQVEPASPVPPFAYAKKAGDHAESAGTLTVAVPAKLASKATIQLSANFDQLKAHQGNLSARAC